jgi:DNA topoisomerase-1
LDQWLKEADDEEKKFASLMPDQNIGNIGLEEALNLFCFQKFRSV